MKRNHTTAVHVHHVLEITAWLLWIASLLVAVYGIRTLPDEIATHFALDGTPDGYGSPTALLVSPLLMLPCLALVSVVVHAVKPEFWNMPFRVREECKQRVYRDMMTMMCAIEAEIAAFTLYAQVKSYNQSGTGVLAAVGGLTIALAATILGMCIRAHRHNR